MVVVVVVGVVFGIFFYFCGKVCVVGLFVVLGCVFMFVGIYEGVYGEVGDVVIVVEV